MLCFRCGSYNPENAQKCSVCGQGFVDESGKAVGPVRRESKTTTPAAIFVPGEMVAGRYRIGELLGQGGVGAVYRARDLEIDVDIALKGITPNLLQTEEEQKNFSKQIKGARKLQHPNIVRIYDEGHEGNRRFFTMKLLEGLTLRKIIRLRHEKGQPFTAEELVPIFHQLAAALDYAHKSTWHGDLKPENIIILPDLLKITDFNLVKALPLKPFLGIAKSRSKGFPYIAPELRVEAQTIDGRCDMYALGVILGEMLTGLVFEGHYSRAMTAALEQLPTKLDGLVRKAVTEHPDGRYQRGADLARDLEAALGAMTTPLPAPAKPPVASTANTVPNPRPAGAQIPPASAIAAMAASSSSPPQQARGGAAAGGGGDSGALGLGQPHAKQLPSTMPPTPPVDDDSGAGDDDNDDNETGPNSPPTGAAAGRSPATSAAAGPAPQLSSDDAGLPPPLDDDVPLAGSDILEIGQSQVLLLQSGVTDSAGLLARSSPSEAPAQLLAEAARRLMAAQSNPEDTLDEGGSNAPSSDNMPTAPRGAPVRKEIVVEPPRLEMTSPVSGGDKLIEALYSDEKDEALIPPPLPSDTADHGDKRVVLSGDDDDEDEPTDERLPHLKAEKNGEIHDALTALKPHPPELMDEDVRKKHEEERALVDAALALESSNKAAGEPDTATMKPPVRTGNVSGERTDKVREKKGATGAGAPPAVSPVIDDDDSLKQTLDVDVLRAAKERSSPSLHRAEPLPPPVIAPPPVLRPVTPPKRQGSSSAPLAFAAILGVVILAAAIVVWRFVIPHDDKVAEGTDHDHATVTTGHGPVDVVPPVNAADAGVLEAHPAIDDHKPIVDDTKPVVVDNTKPPDGTVKPPPDGTVKPPPDGTVKPPPDGTVKPPPDGTVVDNGNGGTKPEEKAGGADAGVMVAMATQGTCPKGMIFIDGGSFQMGSAPGDPMRNFGESTETATDVKAYCIDYYEQPNGKDALPTVGVSWQAAKTSCDRLGRRLCSEKEWERACKGPSSARFPYGNAYDADTCNTEDAGGKPRALAPATAFKKCRSAYKVFMMAGNANEWVLDSVNGNKITKGGGADRPDFSSRCAARWVPPKGNLNTVGFRCCADPH